MPRSIPVDDAAAGPGGDVEIDGAVLARAMKMPVAHFMAEMRRGNVHGLIERGIGEDAGHYRVSLRYRGRELRLVFENGGRLLGEELDVSAPPRDGEVLKARLHQELIKQSQARLPVTCDHLAERIAFWSPRAIRVIGEALGVLMEEDA